MTEEQLGKLMKRLAKAEGHAPKRFTGDRNKAQHTLELRSRTLRQRVERDNGATIAFVRNRLNVTQVDFEERLSHLVEADAIRVDNGRLWLT